VRVVLQAVKNSLFICGFNIDGVNKQNRIAFSRIKALPKYCISDEFCCADAKSIKYGGFEHVFRVIEGKFKFSDSQHVMYSDRFLLQNRLFCWWQGKIMFIILP